jgi:hypothetical protein
VNWSSTTIAIGVLGLSVLGGLGGVSGCAPRPRMCTASTECVAQSACVAGRCQPDKPNVKPAIDAARRIVVHPVDVAYLRRGDGPNEDQHGGELPPLFALGKDSAVLLMRFSVALPISANVVEAYVVLHRTDAVDDDPAPISLHTTRIIDGWNARSTSWAIQPHTAEARTPATIVEPSGPSLVRLDVRDLVRQWPKHDPNDQGIAVVADNETRTGTTFAFRASEATQVEPALSRGDAGPYLELYVR